MPFPAVLADELAALMVGKGRDDLVFTDQRGGVLRNSNSAGIGCCQPAVARSARQARRQRSRRSPRTISGTPRPAWPSAPGANVKAVQRMLGHAKASMTLDVYADLFDEDLDGVADRLDTAIRSAADQLRTGRSATKSPANTDWHV